jgi:leucine-rich repeat protein SHOC2
MAPSKRRKTSAVLEPACGNATSGVRTRRSASARGDLPDAPDADLEPVDECATFSPDGNVATVIYSHVADVQTRGALAMASRSWRDVSMLPASLPRRLDLDGLSKSQIDRLLDVDELTSLDEERMLELAGVDKEDFCEWAAARAGCMKLIAWALERGFPWGGYPPGLVSDDVLALRMWRANDVFVLRTWRAMCPELQERWPEDEQPEDWEGVEMENGRVVELLLDEFDLTGEVPAEIGRLSALRELGLGGNQLTGPVPAEIGQLTSLKGLFLNENQLTSVPAEIGQLILLERLWLDGNQLTSLPAEVWQLTSLDELYLGYNQLTSLPAEIGQLTSLRLLYLYGNRLTSLPAEIGQLTALRELFLQSKRLTSLPAEIGRLRAAGCHVSTDDGVTYDEQKRPLYA